MGGERVTPLLALFTAVAITGGMNLRKLHRGSARETKVSRQFEVRRESHEKQAYINCYLVAELVLNGEIRCARLTLTQLQLLMMAQL